MDYIREHFITLFLTILYIAGCLCIGWYFKKKASEGVEGYYIAKREIPGWVIALAFFSTSASTNTYIGMAGKSFEFGLSWAWMGFIWTLFCIISWQLLGPKMRTQSARLKSFTIPDYFHLRYKSGMAKSIRVLSALIILFATIWYMVGIAKGCAHVFTSVLDVPYEYGAFLIIFITCLYTIWGGMYSVLWTDAVQGIIMFGVAILMLSLPFIYAGGTNELFEIISSIDHPSKSGEPMKDGLVSFGLLVSFLYILGIGASIGMKQISEPKNIIRFYSIDNELVSGFCVAGLFAAGMSSLASVIIIIGTAFVKDIWHVVRPMKEKRIIGRTKVFMLVYCLIVYVLTLFPIAGIVELTAFAGAVFAASFFPSIFGGLYLRWGTDLGALSSMIAGIAMCIIWRFGFRFKYERLEDIHEIIPAFLISLFTYLLVSALSRNRIPDGDHLDLVFK